MTYNPDITAYVVDLADSASVEIGDSKDAVFQPQAKLMRDGNALNLSLRYLGGSVVSGHTESGGVVTAEVDDAAVEFFDKPASGAFEIELVLNERPESNRFDFSIRSKGVLRWDRMAELPPELVARGAVVPEDSVGSLLAIGSDGIPVFDVKRPRITDATGASVWGEVEIIGDVLTVIAPADFLAAAVLPIRVDPTVGYTNLVGLIDLTGEASWPSFLRVTLSEPAKNLVVQVYCSGSGVSAKGLLAAADGAGGVYGTLLGSSAAVALGALGWTPFVIPGTIPAGTYWIGFVTNGSATYKFRDASGQALIDATGAISGYYDSPSSPVPNPGTILSGYTYVMRLDYDVDTGGSGPEMSSLVTGIGTPSATAGPLAQASAEVPGIGTPSGVLLALPPASGASEVIGTSSATLSDLPQASGAIECTGQPSGALSQLPGTSGHAPAVGTATGVLASLPAGSTIKVQLPFLATGTVLRSATITVTAPDGEKVVDAAPMIEVSGFFEYDFTALDSYRGKFYVLATAIIGSKPYRRDGWITILPPQR